MLPQKIVDRPLHDLLKRRFLFKRDKLQRFPCVRLEADKDAPTTVRLSFCAASSTWL
jgi:hypothetical protein